MIGARRPALLWAGALAVALAGVIAAAVTWLGAPSFDASIVDAVRVLRDDPVGSVLQAATEVGRTPWLGPASLLIALLLASFLRHWRDACVVAASTLVAASINSLAKLVFERPRPDGGELLAAGYSMPSGHAASSAAWAASLLLAAHGTRAWRPMLLLAPAFAFVVGLSRVALGVHYPTDVVAGWLLGSGTALLVAGIVGRPDRALADSGHVG